jgi:hypothetical protein
MLIGCISISMALKSGMLRLYGEETTRHIRLLNMEIEDDGHLPFLDIDICRKVDGSLGHKVYRKPTHTNLYLHQKSHHNPANKHSVLSSLVHRAKALCDQ